jgi:hypothetical protein
MKQINKTDSNNESNDETKNGLNDETEKPK